MDKQHLEEQETIQKIKKHMKENNISIRTLAKELGVDASNLAKIVKGNKKLNRKTINRLILIYYLVV
ncbi:MAG: helix-turn-helix domain-containing protein [Pseudomonadota bacterium]|nr:helix-turn-helix domain-containing protein [Pseudomonadota bacterium]